MAMLRVCLLLILCMCTRGQDDVLDTKTFNKGTGPVFAWGQNKAAQLMVGDGVRDATKSQQEPTRMTVLPTSPTLNTRILIEGVAAGQDHSVLLSVDGHVFTTGSNDHGQLGSGDYSNSKVPQFVNLTKTMTFEFATHIAAGAKHTLCATRSGKVYTWGSNSKGQLGIIQGKQIHRTVSAHVVTPLVNSTAVGVVGGLEFSLVITSDGKLWSFGDNSQGQLGVGDLVDRATPQEVVVDPNEKVIRAACGDYHALALTGAGSVYSWGYNSNGQLGHWNTEPELKPKQVHKKERGVLFILSIAAGAYHSTFVTDQGDCYVFGGNRDGQLGQGIVDNNPHPVPARVPLLQKLRGTVVFAGAYHTIAVTADSKVYAWGWNQFGQLGTGDTVPRKEPTLVTLPMSDGLAGVVVNVAAGYGFSIVGTESGDLSGCGFSRYGSFLCGSSIEQLPPFST